MDECKPLLSGHEYFANEDFDKAMVGRCRLTLSNLR